MGKEAGEKESKLIGFLLLDPTINGVIFIQLTASAASSDVSLHALVAFAHLHAGAAEHVAGSVAVSSKQQAVGAT
jgi:hypothetical protein